MPRVRPARDDVVACALGRGLAEVGRLDFDEALLVEVRARDPGDLVPVVEVEVIGHGTKPGLAERLRRFLDLVEEGVGVRPMIYTSPTFWNAHLAEGVGAEGFGEHPLWVAEYGVEEPVVPAGWDSWTLWQWQGDTTVPGIEKDADVSRLHPELSIDAIRVD